MHMPSLLLSSLRIYSNIFLTIHSDDTSILFMALTTYTILDFFAPQLPLVALVLNVNVSTRPLPFTVLLSSSEITRNCPGSISIVYRNV